MARLLLASAGRDGKDDMTSAINSTKPEDGVPAAKADLRANLQVAKSEIEHGGFLTGFTPTNYTAADDKGNSHAEGIDAALGGKADKFAKVGTQDGSYTLTLSDSDKWIRIDSSNATTVTVPAAASVPFAIGTRIFVRQAGPGQTSIAPAVGVTIHTPETMKLRKQHSTGALVKVGSDEWDLMGDLEAGQ
jgi:hypothetical protein